MSVCVAGSQAGTFGPAISAIAACYLSRFAGAPDRLANWMERRPAVSPPNRMDRKVIARGGMALDPVNAVFRPKPRMRGRDDAPPFSSDLLSLCRGKKLRWHCEGSCPSGCLSKKMRAGESGGYWCLNLSMARWNRAWVGLSLGLSSIAGQANIAISCC